MSEFSAPAGIEAAEACKALNAALARAQGAFPKIKQTKTAGGKSYSYTYAPLEEILDKVRKPLADNGLSLTQPIDLNGEGVILRTELRHEAGGMLSSKMPLPGFTLEGAQQFGSAHSYARRYAAQSILGIATEEDDDGQRARSKAKPKPESPRMIDELQRGQIDAALGELIASVPEGERQLSWPGQLRERFRVQSKEELTHDQAAEAIAWLHEQLREAGRI